MQKVYSTWVLSVKVRMRLGIQVQGISKKMGDQQILNNVDMECPCKSITGIIGRNSSGKTVLLKRHYEQGT